jgi:molybdopterin synthase sulfur carrier subunit
MAVTVKIPTLLRSLTGEKSTVTADGTSTLGELVEHLESSYPGMRDRLCEADGQLRRFVNVFVNGEDVRFLHGLESVLAEGDEVSIVPAVAGG